LRNSGSEELPIGLLELCKQDTGESTANCTRRSAIEGDVEKHSRVAAMLYARLYHPTVLDTVVNNRWTSENRQFEPESDGDSIR
jgi:hypothetical protein